MGLESLRDRPILSSWNALLDYCRSAMQFETVEQFRVLFLDKKNKLIADEVLGKGTIDRAPVYPREVIKRALQLEATAIILAHNHPSGDPTPSKADIDMTKKVVQAAAAVNIPVHDHLIISESDYYSFKSHMKPAPILGSALNILRKTSGVTNTDQQNEKYNQLRKRIITISQRYLKNMLVSHQSSIEKRIMNTIIKLLFFYTCI